MKKYKLAIIYGNDLVDGINRNGEIEYVGSYDDDVYHIVSLINYFDTNFLDEEIFRNLTIRSIPTSIAYILTKKGHIVIFNATDNPKRNSYQAFMMMPEGITLEQKDALLKLSHELTGFRLSIKYNLSMEAGIVLEKYLDSNEKLNAPELIKKYVSNKSVRTR